jgi:hypothetical protein
MEGLLNFYIQDQDDSYFLMAMVKLDIALIGRITPESEKLFAFPKLKPGQ